MLIRLLTLIALTLAAHTAMAGEAGKVIFAAGEAKVLERAAHEGVPVQEGELLSTGKDGYLYIKTIDDGLFILRPNTRARIVAYHVDVKNPVNTRIKLELLSGVARSRSGRAVKLARQNFRFNTPVAAIGVRGTDFTVFTDEDTSRVTVFSGGIVVSGFVGACRPDGVGPCEGATSRELSAAQRGQLLQVRRGQAAPQMLSGTGTGSPDQVAAPLPNENVAASSSATPIEAKKAVEIAQAVAQVPPPSQQPDNPPVTSPPPVIVIPPPVVTPTPPVVVVPPPPPQPDRQIVWGRWQTLNDAPATISLAGEKEKNELVAVSGKYALFLTPGKDYVLPSNGSIGFEMADGEAYISTATVKGTVMSAASLENGALNVDFGKRTFATSIDVVTAKERFNLQAGGAVTANGRMFGDSAMGRTGYMNVKGAMSAENGGSAAYIFDSRLDPKRTVNGATFWKPPAP